jgi:hypothetical protein
MSEIFKFLNDHGSLIALISASISIGGLIVSILSFRNSAMARKISLFDKRYDFYTRLKKRWLETGDNPGGMPTSPSMDSIEIIMWLNEAEFLFGKDVMNHINNLEEKEHTGAPFFPDEDFVKPFRKYLKLE